VIPLAPSSQLFKAIRDNIRKIIVGKDDVIDLILVALLCEGHVLIEDVPGVGKTSLISALARSVGLSFHRVQFTPDVLPSDITGFSIMNMKSGEFEYRQGIVMSNIILADEINRTSPKTQSSLLEAMEERHVTVDGTTYNVPRPFMVLATQNPIEYVGTYPLPEAQLDRFLIRIAMGYPSMKDEVEILGRFATGDPREVLDPVCTPEDISALQKSTLEIQCSPAVREYIVRISAQTRKSEHISLGVSPRGSIYLMKAAQACAVLQGRNFVAPDDVQKMANPVMAHRLIVRPEARLTGMTAERIIKSILNSVDVPVVSA
jgi:MoxR-like ATPase